ncbi:MAG: hypothetical protein PVH62_09060 [Anaerolineae bacterium]|jgi:hypothetical protein
MADWRVLLLSGTGLLTLLAGLAALALPDPYEGGVLYVLDPTHSVRVLDGIGLALVTLGGAMAWGAGLLWQRQMTA